MHTWPSDQGNIRGRNQGHACQYNEANLRLKSLNDEVQATCNTYDRQCKLNEFVERRGQRQTGRPQEAEDKRRKDSPQYYILSPIKAFAFQPIPLTYAKDQQHSQPSYPKRRTICARLKCDQCSF